MSSAGTVAPRDTAGGDLDTILTAARLGAPWALRVLYDTYAPAVAGYARAQAATDPEGLVNDVFCRAFRRLESFTGEVAGFRSWIFTIAHNLIVDDARRRARRVIETDPPSDRDLSRSAPSAEDEVMQAASQERVVALLAALPADQRDVLTLRLVADLTVVQVAAVLGRSPGAVKALQRRGLNRLRACIDQGVPL